MESNSKKTDMNYLTSLAEAKSEAKKSFARTSPDSPLVGIGYAIKHPDRTTVLHVSINRDGEVREVNPDGTI